MKYDHRQHREVFHYIFLERLLKSTEPKLYALKGGVNLRFFFRSPRYSEDMDLDIFEGSVATLKKNGYKILRDDSFARTLKTYGIEQLLINDPAKAKQTQTTQRFKVRLVNSAGEEYPTKVEFSRREKKVEDKILFEQIPSEITRPYLRGGYLCPHYRGEIAVIQKIRALCDREEIQTRDPFDIGLLLQMGFLPKQEQIKKELNVEELVKAQEHLLSLTYDDYVGQVIEFLADEDKSTYASEIYWNQICEKILQMLEVK